MDRRQKKLVSNLITVSIFTIVMVFGLVTFKDAVNKSEAIRATELLSKEILAYHKRSGSLPSKNYIDQFLERIGAVRIGEIQYRAQWIGYGSDKAKTILAYSKKNYSGLLKSGYIVIRLNGQVEWMSPNRFEPVLQIQQQQSELDWLKTQITK